MLDFMQRVYNWKCLVNIMEWVDHDTVNLYNARPDYIAKSKPFPIFYRNKWIAKIKKISTA